MSEPVQLTPDALESLLVNLDDGEFAAFVADLYERTGHDTGRRGNVVTTVAPEGDRERLLVWTDDRTRIGRLLGTDTPDPDADGIDAVVSRDRDAAGAAAIAEDAGADHLGAADLHDRLLYAMDRKTCRDLCQDHLGRAVEPRPPHTEKGRSTALGGLSQARIALVGLVVCALIVVGASGLPGAVVPDGDAVVPDEGPGAVDPPEAGPVTPVGGGQGATSTGTTAPPTVTSTSPGTPPPTVSTPTPPGRVKELEPCLDEGDGSVEILCIPPRPVSVTHDADVTTGLGTRINASIENRYDSSIESGVVGIEAPFGWQVRIVGGPTFGAVGNSYLPITGIDPGESRNVSWVLTPPESASGGRYNVTVVSEWSVPGHSFPDLDRTASTDTGTSRFRLARNYTYRLKPSECRGVEPCSLLADGPNGSQPFDPGTVRANATNTTTGVLYNPHDRTITNGTITLEPPNAEWNVTPVNGTTFGTLAPGESRPVTWNLSAPRFAHCVLSEYTLTGTATYTLDGGDRITVPFSLDVAVNGTELCLT